MDHARGFEMEEMKDRMIKIKEECHKDVLKTCG